MRPHRLTVALLLAVCTGFAIPVTATAQAAPRSASYYAKPGSYSCHAETAANTVPEPAPLWQVTKRIPTPDAIARDRSMPDLCPAGDVPSAIHAVGTSIHPDVPTTTAMQGSDKGGLTPFLEGRSMPPAFGGENCQQGGCYWYADNSNERSAIGMEYVTAISEPHVSNFSPAHSIDQLAMGGGAEGNQYTMEAGWDVDPGLWGDSKPHFFIFVNRDKYTSEADCYDCNYISVAGAKYAPGEALTPGSGKIEFGVEYRSGAWWISVGGEWVAYVPESFWEGNFTKGAYEANYGEVFDREQEPTSWMGDGLLGTNSGATVMTAPVLVISETKSETTEYHGYTNYPAFYTNGQINAGGTEWHFGGSGEPRAPEVTTGSATATGSEATLEGTIDPNGIETGYSFEYGETSSYGYRSQPEGKVSAGFSPVPVKVLVTGIAPGKTYHYRLVASSSAGTRYGADEVLSTTRNMLTNSAFVLGSRETGCGAPSNWAVFQGSGTVCAYKNESKSQQGYAYAEMKVSQTETSLMQEVPVTMQSGQSYTFSAWLRAPETGKPVSGNLAVFGLPESVEDAMGTRFTIPADGAWHQVTVTLTVAKPGETSIRAQIFETTTNTNLDIGGTSLYQNMLTNSAFVLGSAESGCSAPSDWALFHGSGALCAYKNESKSQQGYAYAEMKVSQTETSLMQEIPLAMQPGQSHTLSVWLRAPETGKPVSGNLAVFGLPESVEDAMGTRFTIPADGAWHQVTVTLTVSKPGETSIRAQVFETTTNTNLDVGAVILQ